MSDSAATDHPLDQSARFGQIPAASVVAECLRLQADVPARSGLARVLGRSPLTTDSRSWYLGSLGELEVARRLAALPEGWTVLHSVPVGSRGSDIDHVVVGPSGVYTINTKFHDDAKIWVGASRLLVNGQKVDHLRNSRFEADRTARLLSAASGEPVAVRPLLVIVGAKEVTFRERPKDVVVLRDSGLVRWLRSQPSMIPAERAAELAAIASEAKTWGVLADALATDAAAFASLRREVRQAKTVRLLWAAGALVALMAPLASMVLPRFL